MPSSTWSYCERHHTVWLQGLEKQAGSDLEASFLRTSSHTIWRCCESQGARVGPTILSSSRACKPRQWPARQDIPKSAAWHLDLGDNGQLSNRTWVDLRSTQFKGIYAFFCKPSTIINLSPLSVAGKVMDPIGNSASATFLNQYNSQLQPKYLWCPQMSAALTLIKEA